MPIYPREGGPRGEAAEGAGLKQPGGEERLVIDFPDVERGRRGSAWQANRFRSTARISVRRILLEEQFAVVAAATIPGMLNFSRTGIFSYAAHNICRLDGRTPIGFAGKQETNRSERLFNAFRSVLLFSAFHL